jgi:hypothetical protein
VVLYVSGISYVTRYAFFRTTKRKSHETNFHYENWTRRGIQKYMHSYCVTRTSRNDLNLTVAIVEPGVLGPSRCKYVSE